MSAVWYTSDLHLGHGMVAELRGFGTPEEHTAAIEANWRSRIDKRDMVFVLGDLTLQNPSRWVEFINALPGRKHFISGNHDRCHPMFGDAARRQRLFLGMFETVQPFARRKVAGRSILMSHFPYTTDRGFEARFPQWRLPDLGLPLVHGHTHLPEMHMSDHEMHVGLDAWNLSPVPESAVVDWLARVPERDTRFPSS